MLSNFNYVRLLIVICFFGGFSCADCLGGCLGLLYGLFALFENARERYENHDSGDCARNKVGYPFRHVDAFKPYKVSQREAQRNKDYHLAQYCEEKRGFGLTERDVYVLQGHLHKEHDRPHKEERCVLYYNRAHGGACRKNISVNLRNGERQRPNNHGVNKCDYRHVAHAFFQARGVAFAVIIANERLHTVTQSVERQGNKLQRAQHDCQRGGIVSVAAGGRFEVDVKNYLYRAFCRGHDKRRQSQREHGRHARGVELHVFYTEAEQAFFRAEKHRYPHERQELRQNCRKARAVHAHAEREYKQRVERDIRYRADQYGKHCGKRIALRGDKRIKPLREQHEHSARRIDFKIRFGKIRRALRTAE